MKARYLPARPIFLTHFDFTIPYPFLACSGLFTYRPKVSKKLGIYYLLTPLRPPTYYLPSYLPTYTTRSAAVQTPHSVLLALSLQQLFVLFWQSFTAYEISNFAKFAAWILQFLELYVRLLLRSQMGSFFFL
jgi:hypothetical protein